MIKLLFLALVLIIVSCESTNKHPVVLMETNMGTIELTLDREKAPISVKNILSYVEESFYDSTIFHRVIKGFMIQGGGFDIDMKSKTQHEKIKNESGNGLTNKRGSIAMARSSDLNSATCQFFINHRDNFRLDEMRYTVFGEVTEGLDVVDKIADVQIMSKGPTFATIPVKPVVIKSVRLK